MTQLTNRPATRETLGNPGDPRDNGLVITGQDWIDGRQAARLLGLRAHHRRYLDPRSSVAEPLEEDQAGEVSL